MPFSRCLAIVLLSHQLLHAADTRLVRETEALNPVEEQTKLHAPPGFTVQLFASEPMINKPINMAFDARGRLWVSSTVEYPYSADKSRWSDPQGTNVKGSRDAIKILEDTDGDGKADKVTDFANELNIPTGVLPWHKPEHKAGCIAWSIPNIWYFADTDGDDIADLREILFGPLGYEKDTHGMCSSFRLGLDGWVYATHGFNNTSKFKAKDGSSLELHSGNVFRFKPDGSRVESWTHGQVNPFGLAWDRYGNLYSADCHSSPIYQLIRGAHYPSFGKPHDGLSFAPVMCEHTHGSTGICGIVYIDGGVWGPEWDDHTFVGNVVTSRVNHDHVTFTGSTPKANEQPDFITSDDPWFRPVDLQLGPDNALYIADFYNKIIGHYEVPLDHPGRDKERGRIWRVVKKDAKPGPGDFTRMNPRQITAELGNANLTRRRLALGEVRRRGNESWLRELLPCIDDSGKMEPLGSTPPQEYLDPGAGTTPHDAGNGANYKATLQAAYALWACAYLGERRNVYEVLRGLHTGGSWVEDAQNGTPEERSGLQRGLLMSQATQILGGQDKLHPWEKWGLGIIFDSRGSAAGRAATQMLLQRPDFLEDDPRWRAWVVSMLIEQCDRMIDPPANERKNAPWRDSNDVQFIYAMRVLLRDWLSQPWFKHEAEWMSGMKAIAQKPWFLTVMASVPSSEAAAFAFAHADPKAEAGIAWQHIARYIAPPQLSDVIRKARGQTSSSQAASVQVIEAIHNGLSERGAPANAELLQWAQELATRLLDSSAKQPEPAWISTATPENGPKWSLQKRKCADGTEAQVLQSITKGGGDEEKRTGVLKSKTFAAPARLTLWINGHCGFPKSKSNDKSLVRVVGAQSSETLASVFPPRNDVCQRVELDLAKHAGKLVRLEIVDGDDGKAYAWLGVTRIEPAVVSVNDFQNEDGSRNALKTLAAMLQHSAPAALREKLAAYLPPRPAPPPLPVSAEQRKQLDALIASRVAAFAKAKPDREVGANVFRMTCAACHQIKGEGGLIGPQLDGIGARGPERLCDDILDPNRNVDAHFHLHTFTMKDGSVMAGFLKAELGQVNVLADATGEEHRISKQDIAKTTVTPASLMPPTFGQTMDEATFIDLLGYLLNEKAAK